MSEQTIWQMFDDDACRVPHTRDLMRWSLNYDKGTSPFELFCDIVGWSQEIGDAPFFAGSYDAIRHLEASHLADALQEWAHSPEDVFRWLEEAFNAPC